MTSYRIAVLAAMALAAGACSRPGSDDSFQWSAQLAPGTVVHLRNGAGNIVVRQAAAGQSAVVHGSRAWRRGRAKDVRFVTNQHGNDVYICAMWRNSGKCGQDGYRGRQFGGLLSMFSLFHRTTDATASFVAELPANVAVDANTANGSVAVDDVSGGVSARTVNGTVRATNVSGPLNLSTINGDVRVSSAALSSSDDVKLTTTNGSVHADLPSTLDGDFDLSVVNGIVRSDLPLPAAADGNERRHLRGQIGTSTRKVRMRAVNGQVLVTSR